ncbi:MAG: hypothetical protein IH595_04430 [Bacteroidales bacterium]|nr:hypothetical protein [Bacteroidales bacterium]
MPGRIAINLKITALSVLLLVVSMPSKAQSPRSVAREFTKDIIKNHKTILITEPDFLYKFNLNYKNSQMSKEEQDSIAWTKSEFVKNITDSIFLHFFSIGYVEELKKFGFLPFIHKMPIPSNKPDFYADIVQAELEEQYYPYKDTAYLDNKPYVFKKNLNALDVSFWFKVYPASMNEQKDQKVYFTENLLVDDLEGGFSMGDKGTLVYYYKVDKLTLSKIYTYAAGLGRTYADYTFDHLLNNYLQKEVPASKLEGKYWHYDPELKRLYTGDEYKFIELH